MRDEGGDEEDDREPLDTEFECVGSAVIEPPKWVVKGLLPAGLTFLAGPPKSQKTTLEIALCALASEHVVPLMPAEYTAEKTGRVLGWSAEASAGEVRHIAEKGLKTQIREDSSFLIHRNPFSYRLDDPNAVARMLQWLNDYEPVLFFVDPLRDFHSLDEKDDGEMNRLLRPMQAWAKDHDAACLIVHHARKRGDARGKQDAETYRPEEMRGTSAMFGLADAILMTTPVGSTGVMVAGTFKRAQPLERLLKFADWSHEGGGSVTRASPLMYDVYRALRYGAENYSQVARQLAVRRADVLGVVRELESLGIVERSGAKILRVDVRDAEMASALKTWRKEHGEEDEEGVEEGDEEGAEDEEASPRPDDQRLVPQAGGELDHPVRGDRGGRTRSAGRTPENDAGHSPPSRQRSAVPHRKR